MLLEFNIYLNKDCWKCNLTKSEISDTTQARITILKTNLFHSQCAWPQTSIKRETQMSNNHTGFMADDLGSDGSLPSSFVCKCAFARAYSTAGCEMMAYSFEVLIHLESSAGLLRREVVLIDRIADISLWKRSEWPRYSSSGLLSFTYPAATQRSAGQLLQVCCVCVVHKGYTDIEICAWAYLCRRDF